MSLVYVNVAIGITMDENPRRKYIIVYFDFLKILEKEVATIVFMENYGKTKKMRIKLVCENWV